MLLLSEKSSESVLQLISLRPWQSSIYSLFACFLVCNSRTLTFVIRFLVNLLCPVQTVKSEEASNSKKMYSQCVVCHSCKKMCSRCAVYVIHVHVLCGKNYVYDEMIATSSEKVYMTD